MTSANLFARVEQAQTRYLGRSVPGYRTRRVRWSGGMTQVIEVGDGPPMMLVHGGGGAAFQWGPVLSALGQTHRVLAVDRPGHGLADAFDYGNVDLFEHADRFIADLLDGAGLTRVTIAANSMGALFALAFALRSPKRVDRLILVGAPVGMSRAFPLPLRLPTVPMLKVPVRRMMSAPTAARARRFWKRFLVAHPERLDDDFLEGDVACQARNYASWLSLIDRVIEAGGVKPEFVLGERWRTLAVPTLFVMGDKDAVGSADEAERLVATNARLRVRRIPDAGHVPWIDSPDAVVASINDVDAVRSQPVSLRERT